MFLPDPSLTERNFRDPLETLGDAATDRGISVDQVRREARQEVTGHIPTGKGPGRIAVTTDGKTLVYNLQEGEGVGFADIASRKQADEIRLPGPPLSLTLSSDGRYVYAGVQDKDTVVVISVADRKIVRSFRTPEGAGPDSVLPLTEE